jgi:chromosome partitioning protein
LADRMAKIFAIVNQKGGVGKTTTAVNLASYLAKNGKFTLLIDIDPQGNASSGLGVDINTLTLSLYDAIINQTPLAEIKQETNQVGLHVIPGSQDLAGASIELVSVPKREWQLHHALVPIRHDYDYVIIDCPPSLGLLTINALTAADEVLIPVQCEYYALEGLKQLLSTISLVQKHLKPDLRIAGALLTMQDKRNTLSRQVVEEVRRNFPFHVFEPVVPRNTRLAEAPSHGKSILHYDPHSNGARAYDKLAQEIIAKEINFSL